MQLSGDCLWNFTSTRSLHLRASWLMFCRFSHDYEKYSREKRWTFWSATAAMETVRTILTTMRDADAQYSLPTLHGAIDNIQGGGEVKYKDTVITQVDQRAHFGALKESFINFLLENPSERFPEDAQCILSALNCILNPQKLPGDQEAIAQYGHQELRVRLGPLCSPSCWSSCSRWEHGTPPPCWEAGQRNVFTGLLAIQTLCSCS